MESRHPNLPILSKFPRLSIAFVVKRGSRKFSPSTTDWLQNILPKHPIQELLIRTTSNSEAVVLSSVRLAEQSFPYQILTLLESLALPHRGPRRRRHLFLPLAKKIDLVSILIGVLYWDSLAVHPLLRQSLALHSSLSCSMRTLESWK